MRRFAIAGVAVVALVMDPPSALGQESNPETPSATRSEDNQLALKTELMLLRHIEGMRIGKPIYDAMTPELVAAVKPYEEIGKSRFAQLGAIRSIVFRGTSPSGVDTYYVTYENGSSEYLIALTADGKIRALVVRPGQ